mmetsp:Transcript_1296/g.1342  ORF Transcript_1296/g.1342 Transcript_1296/m.1342 type:complete len:99 (+) Transcript_1296:670-966(+)
MAIIEIMAFVYYYIDLVHIDSPACEELGSQLVIASVVLTAISVAFTAQGAGCCFLFMLAGVGFLCVKLKACTESFDIIVPLVGLGIAIFFLCVIPGYF